MIQINQLKLPVTHTEEELKQKISKTLRLKKQQKFTYEILRQSLDARKKNEKKFVYSILVSVKDEQQILNKVVNKNVMSTNWQRYQFPGCGEKPLRHRPVIIGSGPAGLFCGYMLAVHGYRPLILERGEDVHSRQKKVEAFWDSGILDENCNVQFGEGGAGTFSDGKLNTLVKDPAGRNREVLRIFVECGAPKEILYQQKPHLGTDLLITIVENLRRKIQECGGEVRFSSQMTDIRFENNQMLSIEINNNETLPAELLVLALGHSARDTFSMLYNRGVRMQPKAFAVGVRVEHPQEMINQALYGERENRHLGAAAYKVTSRASSGRGVYSFCMCPGGYVVNASSENRRLAVNGMSYSGRSGPNANSALIVAVNPEDYGSEHPLAGMHFQQRMEEAAYRLCDGKVPVQLYGDFCENRISTSVGEIKPCIKGAWDFGNLRECLPDFICQGLMEAMEEFERKIPGFSREDTVYSGVESRTSSPVRIPRDEQFFSNISGIYPCGEGAGYAGGITSAAMDGIRVAEKIAECFAPFTF